MRFLVRNTDAKTIRRLSDEYLQPYSTMNQLSQRYKLSPATISNILWKGIAENIVDCQTAKNICFKAINRPAIGWHQRKSRWDKAMQVRSAFIKQQNQRLIQQELLRKEELGKLCELRESYCFMLESYDSYFFAETDAPTKEELIEKIDKITLEIERLDK